MPVFEYKCKSCKKQYEIYIKNADEKPVCKFCGGELERVYSGEVFGLTGKKCGGCSGDCKHCKGCR